LRQEKAADDGVVSRDDGERECGDGRRSRERVSETLSGFEPCRDDRVAGELRRGAARIERNVQSADSKLHQSGVASDLNIHEDFRARETDHRVA
jgi:hypothetical protein